MKRNRTDKKVRVLLVAPTKPLVGGQSIQAERLERGFEDDSEVELVVQSMNPKFLPFLQRVSGVRTIVTSIKYWFDLLRKVPKSDVVHTFSASYYSFIISPTPAVLIANLFQKPVILHYHSGEAGDHLKRWKKTTRTVLKRVNRIVVPSSFLAKVFKDNEFSAETIPNVIETSQFSDSASKPEGLVFLSNRNLEPLYNVECTIRAFAFIQKRFHEAALVLAGSGSESAHLKDVAQKLNLSNVAFCGSVSQTEMAKLFQGADFYLNSSNIDNLPNSIIEAFAAGVPVISTNAGGIPYILENERTGLLVDVGDCKGLAEAAIRLCENPEFAKTLADNAKQEVSKYVWKAVREEWVNAYRAVIK